MRKGHLATTIGTIFCRQMSFTHYKIENINWA
jgi:hypothetical protein